MGPGARVAVRGVGARGVGVIVLTPCSIKKAMEEATANGDNLNTEGQVAQ